MPNNMDLQPARHLLWRWPDLPSLSSLLGPTVGIDKADTLAATESQILPSKVAMTAWRIYESKRKGTWWR